MEFRQRIVLDELLDIAVVVRMDFSDQFVVKVFLFTAFGPEGSPASVEDEEIIAEPYTPPTLLCSFAKIVFFSIAHSKARLIEESYLGEEVVADVHTETDSRDELWAAVGTCRGDQESEFIDRQAGRKWVVLHEMRYAADRPVVREG